MLNHLKPSWANLCGLFAGVGIIWLLLRLDDEQGGYLAPYTRMIGIDEGRLGYEPAVFSILLAAFIAIIVSFLVTHLIERIQAR